MDDKQRKNKITNLLTDLKSKNIIENTGSDKKSQWIIVVERLDVN
jgi:predicted HTH transcriptional regulator